ncbi:MAG: spermidine/putrescine ABC transporter substrate-binding protein [Acidimicrobiia bacterium]|nr:spermidine/putrescine ABC transporter substrate-binding protein [Acidimicrobiia bacterium]
MKRILVIALAFALLAAACGGDESSDLVDAAAACEVGEVDGDLDLYNWSEYIEPELVTAFEEEFGVTINESFYDSNEAMLPQIESGGNDYDLVVPSDYTVTIMSEEGLIIALNKDAIPNLSNIDPAFTGLPYDENDEYSVPYQWGTSGIGYSYDVVPEDWEVSWEIIFDPDFAPDVSGSISLLNDPRETMGVALKYLGHSINTTDQAELDEAVELIQSIKDRVKLFDSDQFEDLLISGETTVAHGWSGDFFAAFDEASDDDYDAYEDFGYGIPKEGAVAWVDTMAIPITADAPCTAHTFINFILDAENGAALTNFNFYASPNAASEPFVDPEILEDETIYPPDDVFQRLEFLADTGDFETSYSDAFNEVKS